MEGQGLHAHPQTKTCCAPRELIPTCVVSQGMDFQVTVLNLLGKVLNTPALVQASFSN